MRAPGHHRQTPPAATDIPAFYQRLVNEPASAGFCEVPNPFNPAQVSRVSLRAEDVDAIVFWTKNPQPMIEHIAELERAGLRFYFQFSLHDYPALLETASAAGCRKNRRVQATEQDDRRGARYLAL